MLAHPLPAEPPVKYPFPCESTSLVPHVKGADPGFFLAGGLHHQGMA